MSDYAPADTGRMKSPPLSETGARVNAPAEWRSLLTALTGAALLYLTLSGLVIYLWPFGEFAQFSVLVHTVVGLISLIPVVWYSVRHWLVRKKGNLSHYQLLGYFSVALLAACTISGIVVTWQGWFGIRMSYLWDIIHLITGLAMAVFIIVHLATVVVRKVNNPDTRRVLVGARRIFYRRTIGGTVFLLVLGVAWAGFYQDPVLNQAFTDDYNWKFGEDRPFSPSLARTDQSEWISRIKGKVEKTIPTPDRNAYLASFAKVENEPIGLFAQIHRGLEDLELTPELQLKIDLIIKNAAREMQQQGAIDARALSGSAGCGSRGCHSEIYDEWLPSAHRYSAMDDMFQRVQTLMVEETSPEHTRYCAGCHDPISLFSGAKSTGNITLSAEGSDEGSSCLVCHSIIQTDIQGNGDYTLKPPERYVYELKEGDFAKKMSDFLIRTYPRQHLESYSRNLYNTPEFCAACHKQYLDTEVNTDIGKVQGQNQYDSWKNSRWHHEGDPTRTISCRDCHMPLLDSADPASGDVTDHNRTADDGKHRSHRTLASNQYIPVWQNLPGGEKHVELTRQWLRGEYEIPEIADRWVSGPVVRLDIDAPESITAGEEIALRIVLTNNKTGHDFPTGPLDMIESWLEIKVVDHNGETIYHTGALDEDGRISETQAIYKADGFDRQGKLINRHNLWDLVGASYKRTMFPGVTDTVAVQFQCPSMGRKRVRGDDARTAPGNRVENFAIPLPPDKVAGKLTVTAILWYRKANPEFLDTVYGGDAGVRSPVTEMTRATATITVGDDAQASLQ